jgi:type IV pilus assembly protein PilW
VLNPAAPARRKLRQSRGISLVEMMVGIAIGLIIVAAASLMVAGQLADNRRLLLETQIQQDLRAAAELMTRELRRAGYWKDVHRSTAASAELLGRLQNPYSAMTPSFSEGGSTLVSFGYADRERTENNAVDDDEQLGFRLNGTVIESQLGRGNWQALTDPGVMRVTGFSVAPRLQEVVLECALACSAGATICPPRQQLRSYQVEIQAEAVHDSRVQRSIRTLVRVRNDLIVGECRD